MKSTYMKPKNFVTPKNNLTIYLALLRSVVTLELPSFRFNNCISFPHSVYVCSQYHHRRRRRRRRHRHRHHHHHDVTFSLYDIA
jgi:hypothetical protein